MRLKNNYNNQIRAKRLKSIRQIVENTIKESFRRQAIQNDVADYCVIDNNTFTELDDVSGCFKEKNNNTWIVYDTDERAQAFNIKRFKSPQEAYSDLTKRLGFKFVTESKGVSVPIGVCAAPAHRIRSKVYANTRSVAAKKNRLVMKKQANNENYNVDR